MRVIAIAAAAVVLLAGCSGNGNEGSSTPAAGQPPASTAATTVEEPAPTTPAEDKPGLAAAEVVAAFKAAKLPVANPRDNSKNCDELQLGCLELITTDDVSVTTWGDAGPMEAYAQPLGKDAFVLRNVVLSYAAARTPAGLRPKYQAALTRLAG